MSNLLRQIEDSLYPIAKEYTPPSSEVKAIIHQWTNAIIYDSVLFSANHGADKKQIIKKLKEDKLFETKTEFKNAIRNIIHYTPQENPSFSFIDLFAGIGGMRLGFETVGGMCAFSSEYEKNAQSTYFDNFGEYPFGDITLISEDDIPDHDVLLAGFPCQPFSHAGLKLGIDDTRGTLFFDIARILAKKQPKIALLENVKGLISHDKGHTLEVILNALMEIGYRYIIKEELIRNGNPNLIKKEASKMVLKSKDFGVPQNRQRIYIVLWRKELSLDFQYPGPSSERVCVGDILEINPPLKYTISDKLWAGHKRRKLNNKKNGKGFGYGLVTPESEYTNTISARYYKDGSEILIAQKNKNPRKLTPREAARLQGFPEDFKLNKSDVQSYKQFGNSVSVPVIKSIANEITKQLVLK